MSLANPVCLSSTITLISVTLRITAKLKAKINLHPYLWVKNQFRSKSAARLNKKRLAVMGHLIHSASIPDSKSKFLSASWCRFCWWLIKNRDATQQQGHFYERIVGTFVIQTRCVDRTFCSRGNWGATSGVKSPLSILKLRIFCGMLMASMCLLVKIGHKYNLPWQSPLVASRKTYVIVLTIIYPVTSTLTEAFYSFLVLKFYFRVIIYR